MQKNSPQFSNHASPEIRSLRPVFEELEQVHTRYIKAEPRDDTSFWHGERAQVGLLAAAAFLSRNTALIEYPCVKHGKRASPGDLYIRTSRETAFEFEAKADTKVNLRKTKKVIKALYDGLRRASKEARQHQDKECYEAAASFVLPRMNKRPKTEIRDLQDRVISKLKKNNGPLQWDALVWIWDRNPRPRDGQRLYPGVLLAVKQIR